MNVKVKIKRKSSLNEYFNDQLRKKFPGFKEVNCQNCDAKAKRVDLDHFKCDECGAIIRLEIANKE